MQHKAQCFSFVERSQRKSKSREYQALKKFFACIRQKFFSTSAEAYGLDILNFSILGERANFGKKN
jgi:hypothetical protein